MNDFLKKEGYDDTFGDEFGDCTKEVSFKSFAKALSLSWFSTRFKNDYGFADDKPCLFFRINKVIDWEPLGFFAEDIDAAFTEDESNILSSEGYCSYDRFQKYCRSKVGKEEIKRVKEEIFSKEDPAASEEDSESSEERATEEDSATKYNAPFLKCIGYSGAENVSRS